MFGTKLRLEIQCKLRQNQLLNYKELESSHAKRIGHKRTTHPR